LYALSRLLKETRWVSLGGDEDDDLVAGSNHNPAVIYHRPLLNPLLHPLSRLLEETRWVRLESERNPDESVQEVRKMTTWLLDPITTPAVIYHHLLLNPLLHPLSRLLEETRWVSLGGDVDDDLVAGSNHNPAVIYHRPLLNPLLRQHLQM
jgi:hypothetical protein